MLAMKILSKLPESGELKLPYDGIDFIFTRVEDTYDYSLRLTAIVDGRIVNYRDFVPIVNLQGIAVQIAGDIDINCGGRTGSVEQITQDIEDMLFKVEEE